MEIADDLICGIKEGIYPEGGKIPSEAELRIRFGAQRTVVRKALARLTETGWITPIQGKGCFVNQRRERIHYVLSSKTAFSAAMKSKGLSHHGELLHWQKRMPNEHEINKLVLSEDQPIYELEILRYVGTVPLSVTTTLLPEFAVPNLEKYLQGFHSLYQLLIKQYRLKPRREQSIIQAAIPTIADAQLLNVPESAPMMRIESRVSHAGSFLIESSISRIRGDRNQGCVRF